MSAYLWQLEWLNKNSWSLDRNNYSSRLSSLTKYAGKNHWHHPHSPTIKLHHQMTYKLLQGRKLQCLQYETALHCMQTATTLFLLLVSVAAWLDRRYKCSSLTSSALYNQTIDKHACTCHIHYCIIPAVVSSLQSTTCVLPPDYL